MPWIDCTRAPKTSWAALEDKNVTQAWRGKVLPQLPEKALAAIYMTMHEGNVGIQVRVWRSSGEYIVLKEPRHEFPSDTMIAQVLLVS